MTLRLLHSRTEAAALCGISVRSLDYLISSGRMACVRLGRRKLVPHSELERLIRKGFVKATATLDVVAPIRPRKQEGLGRDPEAFDGPR